MISLPLRHAHQNAIGEKAAKCLLTTLATCSNGSNLNAPPNKIRQFASRLGWEFKLDAETVSTIYCKISQHLGVERMRYADSTEIALPVVNDLERAETQLPF